jgi:archaellum component FlaC
MQRDQITSDHTRITEAQSLPDLLLVLVSILFVVTVAASAEYYRQLRKARIEYEKAKGAVDDIVLSFNRQLRQEAERLETVSYKVETLTSRDDGTQKSMNEVAQKLDRLETVMNDEMQSNKKMANEVIEVGKRERDVATSQEQAVIRITRLEEQINKLSATPEVIPEGVMPIRREKAMAHLTETEISVLEMLTSEGAKTAPEIKERVKLSREHTARLMKKLYEDGYLERDTKKIPFKYSIKKEMEKLLKKTENEPA